MQVEIAVPKRGRKCSICSEQIEAGVKYLLTTEWQTGIKYPIKKNICFSCADTQISLIKGLKALIDKLIQLKVTKQKEEEVI